MSNISASHQESRKASITAADHVAALPSDVKSMVKTFNFDSSVVNFVFLEKQFCMLQISYREGGNGTLTYSITGPDVGFHSEHNNIGESFWKKTPVTKSNFYEFVAVRKGSFDFYFGDGRETLHCGQCALLNPNVSQRKEYREDCDVIEIEISVEMMKRLTDSMEAFGGRELANTLAVLEECALSSEKIAVYFTPRIEETVEPLLPLLIAELNEKQPGYISVFEGYVERLLSKLLDPSNYSARISRRKVSKAETIFQSVKLLIEKRSGCISGDAIQAKLGYNKDYLNRIVKNYSGMSLKEYCDYCKMKKVAAELVETEKSVNEIIEEMQFSGSSTFYRQFKKFYHVSPEEYRTHSKMHTSQNDE